MDNQTFIVGSAATVDTMPRNKRTCTTKKVLKQKNCWLSWLRSFEALNQMGFRTDATVMTLFPTTNQMATKWSSAYHSATSKYHSQLRSFWIGPNVRFRFGVSTFLHFVNKVVAISETRLCRSLIFKLIFRVKDHLHFKIRFAFHKWVINICILCLFDFIFCQKGIEIYLLNPKSLFTSIINQSDKIKKNFQHFRKLFKNAKRRL